MCEFCAIFALKFNFIAQLLKCSSCSYLAVYSVAAIAAPTSMQYDFAKETIGTLMDDEDYEFIYRNLDLNCNEKLGCIPQRTWMSVFKRHPPSFYESVRNVKVTKSPFPAVPSRIFYKFENLTTFQMTHQNIEQLTIGDFDNGNSLTFVNLSSNHIQRLDFGVFAMTPILKRLDLSHNWLSEITNSLDNVLQLKELYLHGNRLVHFESHGVLSWTDLSLTLNNNRLQMIDLEDMDHFLSEWPIRRTYKYLNLSNNPEESSQSSGQFPENEIDFLVADLTNISAKAVYISAVTTTLNAGWNRISKVTLKPSNVTRSPLVALRLNHNDLQSFNQLDGFSQCEFPNLTTFDLSYNAFERVSSNSFSKMPNLKRLNLNNNKLLAIDVDLRTYLGNVRALDLSYNPLEEFEMSNLPSSVSELGLEAVGLKEIDPNIRELLPNLQSIAISGNSLNCMQTLYVMIWLNSIGISSVFKTDINVVIESCSVYERVDYSNSTSKTTLDSSVKQELESTTLTNDALSKTPAAESTETLAVDHSYDFVGVLDAKIEQQLIKFEMRIIETLSKKLDELTAELSQLNHVQQLYDLYP